jgi:effector-binding domain-containing protein
MSATTIIETPQVVVTEPVDYAALHLVVPREEIRERMGPGIREVYAAVAAQGIAPAGVWFTHHFRRPGDSLGAIAPNSFDFEICVPVAAAFVGSERVYAAHWPAMRVARAIYPGDYEQLAEAWAELVAWIDAQGLGQSQDLWERYLVGPEHRPAPQDWRTELSRPLL